jgi:HK97 gp10 family phage protein
MEMKFGIGGVDDLKRTLAALNTESATKAGTVATREGAKIVKEAFIAAAPVGTEGTIRTRTTKRGKKVKSDYGRLRDNIVIRKIRGTNQHQIKFAVGVGDAFWGMFLEFGTRFMAARPWMRPAFDAAAARVIDQIGALLGKGIEREGKRLFRKGRKQGLL